MRTKAAVIAAAAALFAGAAAAPARGVDHLADACTDAAGRPVAPERRTFVSRGMKAVPVAGGAAVTASVTLPESAFLLFSTAVSGSPDSVAAEIRVGSGGAVETVWRDRLEPRQRWAPVRVDLASFSGKKVNLTFRVQADPAVTVWWGSPVTAGTRDGRNDVLLYEIDTLREDLLEPFGYPGRSSPRIGSLARGGAVFSECTSSASWTRPAATSILTSLSAATHGVIDERLSLPADVVTMSDLLRDAGWYTVAFQTNPNAGRAAGLDQGFDLVIEMNALMEHVVANRDRWTGRTMFSTGSSSGASEMVEFLFNDLLPDWSGLPLFLYIHPNDPHAPYDPRAPFSGIPGFGRDGASRRVNKPLTAYSRDVRSADWFLGHILDRLEETGRLDRTVVALVSDHGEEFHDHGRTGHGVNLYPETLRVPLVLHGPGVPAGVARRDRVTVTDICPTVMDLVGLEPPPGAEGRSLVPLLDGASGGDRFPEDPAFAQVITMKLRMEPEVSQDPAVLGTIAVLAGPWKCIVSDYASHREEPSVRLYDLRTDPGEQDDVAADHPELAATMAARARAWWAAGARIAGGREVPEEEIDPEMVEQLKALGYIE